MTFRMRHHLTLHSLASTNSSKEKVMLQTIPVNDLVINWYRELQERCASGKQITGLATGFVELDRLLGGLQTGNLYLVGSPSGGGRSSFLLNLAMNSDQGESGQILMFTLESDAKQLIERMMAVKSRVSLDRFRFGQLDDHEWCRITEASCEFSETKISIIVALDWTLDMIADHCREIKGKSAISLILIDGLKSLPTDQPASWLKKLAREIEAPIIASTFSRTTIGLADIEQHGDAAFEADAILHIWDRRKLDDAGRKIAEIAVVKNRQGPVGIAPLRVEWEYAAFFNA